jgi:hypothetical protein
MHSKDSLCFAQNIYLIHQLLRMFDICANLPKILQSGTPLLLLIAIFPPSSGPTPHHSLRIIRTHSGSAKICCTVFTAKL